MDNVIADIEYEIESAEVQKQIMKKEHGNTRLKTRQRATVLTGGSIREFVGLVKYQPQGSEKGSILAALKENIRKYAYKKSVEGHTQGAFNIAWYLRGGINKLFIGCINYEKLVPEFVKITIDYYKEIVRSAAAMDADSFILEDDARKTALLISLPQFEKFIPPSFVETVSEVKKHIYPVSKTRMETLGLCLKESLTAIIYEAGLILRKA